MVHTVIVESLDFNEPHSGVAASRVGGMDIHVRAVVDTELSVAREKLIPPRDLIIYSKTYYQDYLHNNSNNPTPTHDERRKEAGIRTGQGHVLDIRCCVVLLSLLIPQLP